MIALTTVDDIEKIVRAKLIEQSELNPKQVRNALSLHGEALEKWLDEQTFASIGLHVKGYDFQTWDESLWDELSDKWSNSGTMMLFELQTRDNTGDMSEDEGDVISYYRSYRVYVTIYGTYGNDISNITVARLRTQAVRLSLRNSGIYLERVSNPVKLNEYKNETMWTRNDFEIDISCKMNVAPISYETPFEKLNDIFVKEVK